VAEPKDESKAQALPDPELNPLLNPLLGAHMGRWAEVYFTSPPEKRVQAVSELVRELANNSTPPYSTPAYSTPGHVSTQVSNGESMHRTVEDEVERKESSAEPEPATLVCGSCGHRNSTLRRFCGMCGSPQPSWSEDTSHDAEGAPVAGAAWDEPAAGFPEGGDPQGALESVQDAGNLHQREELLSPFADEGLVPFEVLSSYQSEHVSSGYRIYVGVVLAILLGLLVYMTWRGNAAFWSSGAAPSALPRAVPTPTEAQPAAAAEPPATKTLVPSPKSDASTAASASAPQSHKKTRSAQKDRTETDRKENDRKEKAGRETTRPAPRVVPVTASSATSAAEQNGSEELAMAERYLNAGPGTVRDSRQASAWLWKAVGKQNLTATMLLSDLYLRGDGVTKSCDQARLLLDAAARKGGTAAAQRLRNMQAFGCQ
jgi:hypothetical protein